MRHYDQVGVDACGSDSNSVSSTIVDCPNHSEGNWCHRGPCGAICNWIPRNPKTKEIDIASLPRCNFLWNPINPMNDLPAVIFLPDLTPLMINAITLGQGGWGQTVVGSPLTRPRSPTHPITNQYNNWRCANPGEDVECCGERLAARPP